MDQVNEIVIGMHHGHRVARTFFCVNLRLSFDSTANCCLPCSIHKSTQKSPHLAHSPLSQRPASEPSSCRTEPARHEAE